MSDEEGRKYLAHYMIDAWRRRGAGSFIPATIRRESFCESPEITFHHGGEDFRFAFGHTPFNSPQAERLISDKWQMFQTLRDELPLPYTETIAKNDPRSDAEISESVVSQTSDKWHPFSFPVVVKPSEGSLSRNVFIAKDREQLIQAIHANRMDSSNGHGILFQQYLGDEQGLFREIRGLCFDGKTRLAYERTPPETLSSAQSLVSDPAMIAQPGVVRGEVTDPAILAQIDAIAEHLYENYGVAYIAFDMKCDRSGKMWVLEGNVAPMGLDAIEREIPNSRLFLRNLTDDMLDKVITLSPQIVPNAAATHSPAEPEFF